MSVVDFIKNTFSPQGQEVFSLAVEEAQRFNHNYVGTEHILLGLVRQNDSIAFQVLADINIKQNKVYRAVEFIIGRGETSPKTEIGLTPRSQVVIKFAVDEARRMYSAVPSSEHILLALIREGEGIGAGVLETFGANLETVRTMVLQKMSDNPEYVDLFQQPRLAELLAMHLKVCHECRSGMMPIIHHMNESFAGFPGMENYQVNESNEDEIPSYHFDTI